MQETSYPRSRGFVDPLADRIVPIVTVTVLDNRGRLLLLKRHKPGEIFDGYWEVVGGRIEFGETSQEAAVRELREEAGISGELQFVTVLEHVGRHNRFTNSSYHRIMFVYGVVVDEVKVIKTEHKHYRWIPIEDLPGNIIPFNREAIYCCLSYFQCHPKGQLPLFSEYAFERRLTLIRGRGNPPGEELPGQEDERIVQYSLFSQESV